MLPPPRRLSSGIASWAQRSAPFEVGVEDEVDRLLGQVLELFVDRDGCIRDDDVEPAEALARNFDRTGDVGARTHVPGRGGGVSADGCDRSKCLVQACRVGVVGDDGCAGGREREGRGLPDPRAGARDERDLAVEHTHLARLYAGCVYPIVALEIPRILVSVLRPTAPGR